MGVNSRILLISASNYKLDKNDKQPSCPNHSNLHAKGQIGLKNQLITHKTREYGAAPLHFTRKSSMG
uniref:Uncharacterized protein n=1 Tax=Arundo donax TaxID=35708 RepID=A0A0A9FFM2_ARUDO